MRRHRHAWGGRGYRTFSPLSSNTWGARKLVVASASSATYIRRAVPNSSGSYIGGPGATPRVSIARLATYDPAAVERALQALLEPLGGMGAFVTPRMRVALKPNVPLPNAPELAICTHPGILHSPTICCGDPSARVRVSRPFES